MTTLNHLWYTLDNQTKEIIEMKINMKDLMTSLISALFGATALCVLFGVFPYVLTMGSFWTTLGTITGGLYVALRLIAKSDE